MSTIGELVIKVNGDISGLQSSLGRASSIIITFGGGVERATGTTQGLNTSLSKTATSVGRVSEQLRDAQGRFAAAAVPARTLADGVTRITPAATEAGNAIRTAGGQARDAGGRFVGLAQATKTASLGLEDIASKAKTAGKAMTLAVTVPIIGAGVVAVSAAAQMDSLTRGLTAVTGSAAETKIQLGRLEEVAKLPGLGFREAIQGSINLQAAGLSARTSERALKAFGNALATVGKGKADLDGVTLALTQMASKSKISAEEINQLNERVPQIRQAMLAAFGTADTIALGKAGITPAKFIEAILVQLERLPQVTGGAANSFENFSDALFRARAAIGEKLLPAIVPLIEGLATMLVRVREVDPITIRWAISIAAVAAAAGPLVYVIGSLVTACTALAGVLGVAGLAGALAVGGPILIGIAALSALFIQNKLAAFEAESAANRYAASLVNLNEKALLFLITQRQTGLFQIQEQERALRRGGGAFRNKVVVPGLFGEGGIGAILHPFAETSRIRVVRVETDAMRELGNQANEAGRDIADLSKAFAALQERGKAPTTTPLAPAGGTDRLAGLMDQLTDRLREFRTLAQFEVPSLNLLPPDIQEQIRLVDSLASQLDTLKDGLKRFRDAGRAPPEGLVSGIETIKLQLNSASDALESYANNWRAVTDAMIANQKVVNELTPGVKALADELKRSTLVRRLPSGKTEAVPVGEVGQRGNLLGNLPAVNSADDFATHIRSASDAIIVFGELVRIAGREIKDAGKAQLNSALGAAVNMAAQFTPAGLAAYALSSALDSLRPFVDALLLPVKLFGDIVAMAINPVLRILFPIVKAVVIVFSYLLEATDRVIGTLLKGVGFFVRSIGKIVNFLDPFGNPGNGLVKLGEGIRDSGTSFLTAAEEIAKKRKELEKLNFDDALDKTADAANKLTESMLNAVQGFKIARFRFGSMDANSAVPSASIERSAASPAAMQVSYPGASFSWSVDGSSSPREAFMDWVREGNRLARSHPAMRPFMAQFAGVADA